MATDFEVAVLEQLGEIRSISSTAAANAAAAIAASRDAADALSERLFNGGTGVIHELQKDIQEIKDERESEAKWTRLHNVLHYSLGPILVGLHEVLRKSGISI